ncbi:MAG TPA: response regulator transcription factor [Candidatus Nanopelagicales bacterium]|nr:response regulator transcription factor [Candidatus Nanopelagicales bacterium]
MRVILVEDHTLLREGLARVYLEAGHDVVGSLASCADLDATIASTDPDLVVLDVRLPPDFGDEGARAAAEIKRGRPSVGVLLLSQHIETTHSVSLAGMPGFGYLLKDRVLDVGDFLAASDRVASGGSALEPDVVARLLDRADRRDRLATLTDREHDVLRLMAQGLTNTGIARRLVLSERTVEAHVRRLLIKLDLDDSEDANRRVLAVMTYLGATDDRR